MQNRKFLILGEVFVDTHLDIPGEHGSVVRLGGVFHAARGFSALEANYALAYYAPSYLEKDIEHYAKKLGANAFYCLGTIDKNPSVMLIKGSQEVGPQGYENVLAKQIEINDVECITNVIAKYSPTDILILPGRYSLQDILSKLNDFDGAIHIDINYDCEDLLDYLSCQIETVIASTSSNLFRDGKCDSISDLIHLFENKRVNRFLLKENRGGACCFDVASGKTFESCAHLYSAIPTLHSVGVGDVFNSIFVSPFSDNGDIAAQMQIASLCAASYSRTMLFEKFKSDTSIILNNCDEFLPLEGIRLPWEKRRQLPIYMAAPDFPHVNTQPLNDLVQCLEYHNFIPRLPIRENGLFSADISKTQELEMYNKDLNLLNECKLLIATLLYNDPGTYTELGIFKQMGKPTIIYDPCGVCDNMFARNTPTFFCRTLDAVINATFELLGKE